MSENSAIEWTDHTFNPWIGCTKVSPGCAHCYAETLMDTRLKQVNWGPGQPRKRTSQSNWSEPYKWDRAQQKLLDWSRPGMSRIDYPVRRPRVFCASLADWLDPEVPIEWLADLLDLIRRTPNLDWLLLTKRPELFRRRMGEVWHDARNYWESEFTEGFSEWLRAWAQDLRSPQPPANVWIGTTVEDQERADKRIPQLLQIPAKVRFLSCEPLLGPVDLALDAIERDCFYHEPDAPHPCDYACGGFDIVGGIDWVIAGGESGPKARPMHPDWARDLRDQCQAASIPFLFKQWGEWAPDCLHGPLDSKPCKTTPRPQPGSQGVMFHCGKKAAGRELDGQIHHAFPSA